MPNSSKDSVNKSKQLALLRLMDMFGKFIRRRVQAQPHPRARQYHGTALLRILAAYRQNNVQKCHKKKGGRNKMGAR